MSKKIIRFGWIPMLLLWITACQEPYDVLILNGQVYNGKGGSAERIDVAIRGNEIVSIGDLSNKEARTVIDAAGKAVVPGFIDLHAHIEPIMEMPTALSALHQGVTTVVGGPDGSSPYPLGAYMDSL